MTEQEIERARKRMIVDEERDRKLREADERNRKTCFESNREWRKTYLNIEEWYNNVISKL